MVSIEMQTLLRELSDRLVTAESDGNFEKARQIIMTALGQPAATNDLSLQLGLKNELARSLIGSWRELSRDGALETAWNTTSELVNKVETSGLSQEFRTLIHLTQARVLVLGRTFSIEQFDESVTSTPFDVGTLSLTQEMALLAARYKFVQYASRRVKGDVADAEQLLQLVKTVTTRPFKEHVTSRPSQAASQVVLAAHAAIEHANATGWTDQNALTDGFTYWAASMQTYRTALEPAFVDPTELASLFVRIFCGACLAASRSSGAAEVPELRAIASRSAHAPSAPGRLNEVIRTLKGLLGASRSARVLLIGSAASSEDSPEARLLGDYLENLQQWLIARPNAIGIWERYAHNALLQLGTP